MERRIGGRAGLDCIIRHPALVSVQTLPRAFSARGVLIPGSREEQCHAAMWRVPAKVAQAENAAFSCSESVAIHINNKR